MTPHPQPPAYRWVVLVGAVLAQATFSAVYFGLPSIGSEIAAADDLAVGEVGLILSAPLFGMLLAVTPVGAAADRFGERPVISGGLAVAALALLVASFTSGPVALAACLVVAGLFGASAAIGGRAAAAWFPPEQRAFAVSARQCAPMLGAAAASASLPFVATAFGVETAFLVLAGGCAAGALLAALVLRRAPGDHGGRAAVSTRSAVFANRGVVLVSVAAALLQLTGVSLLAFTPLLLTQERGWSVEAAGVLLSLTLLVAGAGRVVGGAVAQRMRSRLTAVRILTAGAAVCAIALAAAVAVGASAVPAVAALAIVLAASGNGISAAAVVERVPLEVVGTALGFRMTMTLTANAVAPATFGILVGHLGWPEALAIASVPAVAALGVLSLPALR